MDIKDIIIIGGGPAGLSAAIYSSRATLKTTLIERGMPGGQAATTEMIENYPGFPQGVGGPELMMAMHEQALKFGVESAGAEVLSLSKQGPEIVVHTDSGDHRAKAVIVATGAQPRLLNIPGEDQFRGRGVSFCATCDGAFFSGKKVAVIGGGDAAVEEALFLSKIVDKIYLIHRRDQLRATKILQERALQNSKIEFIWNAAPESILGNDKVEAIRIKDLVTGETKSIAVDGVFIYVGMFPNTNFLKGFLELSDSGSILVNHQMITSVPGVFAAGDVCSKSLRQVVTAVSDGAIAAVEAEKYIETIARD